MVEGVKIYSPSVWQNFLRYKQGYLFYFLYFNTSPFLSHISFFSTYTAVKGFQVRQHVKSCKPIFLYNTVSTRPNLRNLWLTPWNRIQIRKYVDRTIYIVLLAALSVFCVVVLIESKALATVLLTLEYVDLWFESTPDQPDTLRALSKNFKFFSIVPCMRIEMDITLNKLNEK